MQWYKSNESLFSHFLLNMWGYVLQEKHLIAVEWRVIEEILLYIYIYFYIYTTLNQTHYKGYKYDKYLITTVQEIILIWFFLTFPRLERRLRTLDSQQRLPDGSCIWPQTEVYLSCSPVQRSLGTHHFQTTCFLSLVTVSYNDVTRNKGVIGKKCFVFSLLS